MRHPINLATLFAALAFSMLNFQDAAAQHDPGRDAMKLLVQDKFKAGQDRLAKPPKSQNSPISEAERNFVLAILSCKQDHQPEAIGHLQKAVELGLPIERILAGPRHLFEPLQNDPAYAAWLSNLEKPLLHGPMLSSVTDTTAQVWIRTAKQIQVNLLIHEALDAPQPRRKFTTKTTAQNDYTGVIHITNLKPDTRYQYQLSIDGEPQTDQLTFRTMPKAVL